MICVDLYNDQGGSLGSAWLPSVPQLGSELVLTNAPGSKVWSVAGVQVQTTLVSETGLRLEDEKAYTVALHLKLVTIAGA
jgi:hypothetical protein